MSDITVITVEVPTPITTITVSEASLSNLNPQLYVSDTQPSDTRKYLWVETGLGESGDDVTLWLNT